MNNSSLENTVLQVPIEEIIPNRFQPRLSFDDASLNDLASSIKQHGIIQPLVLRRKNDKYEIIAGERRFKAAKIAGLSSVPAVISNLDDNASAEVAIVENIQRKDLTAIEEARSFQALLDKGYMTQDELARKMGLSQSAISNKLRLLTLDESVQEAILAEKISERHARTLLKVPSHEKQKELVARIINERLTVRQLEEVIKESENTGETKMEPIENIQNNILNNQINNTESLENLEPVPTTSEELDSLKEPIPNNIPSIEDMLNNSVDIKSLQTNRETNIEQTKNIETITPDRFFSNPEKMPNKFFNFLEDSAANMDVEEFTPTFTLDTHEDNLKPSDLINKTDNIEMLDDFVIPTSTTESKLVENDYLDYVIKTIRSLNLDSDKVVIEEMNLPTEYHINIKIKKDKI